MSKEILRDSIFNRLASICLAPISNQVYDVVNVTVYDKVYSNIDIKIWNITKLINWEIPRRSLYEK